MNELVRRTKLDDDKEALGQLVAMFEPLFRKISHFYFRQYGDLISLDTLLQECRSQFIDLTLNSHTIGGPANFTHFINIFLFRRIQKFVTKERNFHYQHNRMDWARMSAGEEIEPIVEDEDITETEEVTASSKELLADVLESIYSSGNFDEKEVTIFEETILKNKSDTEVALATGMSRPYVSRLHKRVLNKIRGLFGSRWAAITATDAG